MKRFSLLATGLLLAACATVRGSSDVYAHVNPASIAAAPASWDGKKVEIVGLLVWDHGNLGLYQSYGAYCRGGEHTVIYADWNGWPNVSQADNRRQVIVRGIFRNQQAAAQPSGSAPLSTPPGPGPLEPVSVVRWLSAPLKPCPSALP